MATDEEDKAPAEKMSRKMLIILVLVGLLSMGVGGGVTWFFAKEKLENSSSDENVDVVKNEHEAEKKAVRKKKPKKLKSKGSKKGKPHYFQFDPSFVTNLSGGRYRHLSVSIELMAYDPEEFKSVEEHRPLIRHELGILLAGHNFQQLLTRTGRDKLSQVALKKVQEVLKNVGSESDIKGLYFSKFVMQ